MNRIGSALLRYFIKGLLIVVPIALSIFIVVWGVTTIDSWLNINTILGDGTPTGEAKNIPGLGLILVLLIILGAGIFVTYFVNDTMHHWFKRFMVRLPLINFIYSSIKDLTEAFVGDDKKFNSPVIVEVEGNLKRIGFLTQSDLSKLKLPGEAIVYFPFSYSFAGQIYIVDKSKIKPLDMNASEAMKLVVSGGVTQL